MIKKLITVDEIARLFDLSVASVNYYTNIGLINVLEKRKNCRFYDKDDVARRITKVREMMNIGYTIRLIQREFINTQTF